MLAESVVMMILGLSIGVFIGILIRWSETPNEGKRIRSAINETLLYCEMLCRNNMWSSEVQAKIRAIEPEDIMKRLDF